MAGERRDSVPWCLVRQVICSNVHRVCPLKLGLAPPFTSQLSAGPTILSPPVIMSTELASAWWKKNKAKTLLTEPLTKALEALDRARATMAANPSRENLSALVGATKLLPGAIAQTEAKCNKTLHKDTLANLRQMEALAKAAYPL